MSKVLWRAMITIAAANAGRGIYVLYGFPPCLDWCLERDMARKNAQMNAMLLAADLTHQKRK